MMQKWLKPLFLISICTISFTLAATKNDLGNSVTQPVNDALSRPPKENRVHNIGTLWNTVSNFGSYGDPSHVYSSMEWPAESGVAYLWSGGLWIGALTEADTFVSQASYGNYDWMPSEGSSFEFGPFKSMLDSYVMFDDLLVFSGHTPLGIQVFQRALTWSTDDWDDFIAYEYEIVNVGNQVLNDVFIGWNYDSDVGSGTDPSMANVDDLVDYDGWHSQEYSDWHGLAPNLITEFGEYIDIVENIDKNENGELDGYDAYGVPFGDPHSPRYDPTQIHPDGYPDEWQVYVKADGDTLLIPRGVSYMYDADDTSTVEDDTGELGLTPNASGYIGGRLLYAPISAFYETADDTLPRLYAHQWCTWENNPGDDIQRYQLLTGNFLVAPGTRFMRNPLDFESTAFDYRFLTSAGPVSEFAPGDVLRLVYVAAVGQGLRGLRENMDHAMNAYYSGSENSDPAHPSDPVSDAHWAIPGPPITTFASVSPAYAHPGQDSVKISARVYDANSSVEMVQANIHLDDDSLVETIPLVDNGTLGDEIAGDSIYTNTWPMPGPHEAFYKISIYTSNSDSLEITRYNLARFTSAGPVAFKQVVLSGDDTTPDCDEDICFRFELENQGSQENLESISARMATSDEYVVYAWPAQSIFDGAMPPGTTQTSEEEFTFKVSPDCPPGHEVEFELAISSENIAYWRDHFNITISDDKAPKLIDYACDRLVEPGEPMNISVQLIDGAGIKIAQAYIQCPDDSTIASVQLVHTHDDVYEAQWTTPADAHADYDIDIELVDNLDNTAYHPNLMGFTTGTFTVRHRILLVDNDNYNFPSFSSQKKPYDYYYREALDSCGVGYDVYSTYFYGTPDSALLASYIGGLIIWETGDTRMDFQDAGSKPPLIPEEEINLMHFLDNGGKLFMTGQGIGSACQACPNFFNNYLGISILQNEVSMLRAMPAADDEIVNGMLLRLYGGTGAQNQIKLLPISPIKPTTFALLEYPTHEAAAVKVEDPNYRIIFLGFGFEAIGSEKNRIKLMQRIIDWMDVLSDVEQIEANQILPEKFALHQNYPNPFNPATTIQYDLPEAQHVQIQILNVLGQRVATLLDKRQGAGSYEIAWDAARFSSGVYIIRFVTEKAEFHRKTLLLK